MTSGVIYNSLCRVFATTFEVNVFNVIVCAKLWSNSHRDCHKSPNKSVTGSICVDEKHRLGSMTAFLQDLLNPLKDYVNKSKYEPDYNYEDCFVPM